MRYEKRKFKNGLTALAVPMKGTETVTISVLVGTGSVYEHKKISGVSHFLEHLFFKGTKNRPTPGEVNRDMDRLGAEHNAFTSKEVTGFWIKSADRHFARSLEIVSDILMNPIFKADELEKERGVILQELSMYEDMPQRDVWSLFDKVIYGNQPAGWDIGGTPETVKGITRDAVINYRDKQYMASNALVVVAGNIAAKDVFTKVERAFAQMPKGNAYEKKKVVYRQSAPRAEIKHKKSDQTHLVIGAQAFDMFDERRHALSVLGVILGGNQSSRLFMEIREQLGLAYYVGARANLDTYGGNLAAFAGVPHGNLKQVVKKIGEVFANIRKNGVSLDELKLAKDYLRGTMALSFESSDELAMFYGEQELFHKKIMTPEDLWKKIEKVSAVDVLNVARAALRPERMNMAAIGPHRDGEVYKSLLA